MTHEFSAEGLVWVDNLPQLKALSRDPAPGLDCRLHPQAPQMAGKKLLL